jgi:hypothetical protein
MKHRVTIKAMGAQRPLPGPVTYDVDVEDPMAAHSVAAKLYREEKLDGRLIPGVFLLSSREDLSPC